MRLAIGAIGALLLSPSFAEAAKWFIPTSGGCVASDASPKELMDTISKLGGTYEVTDSGGDQPAIVTLQSDKFPQFGFPVDTLVFFRAKSTCDTMSELAGKMDAEQKKDRKSVV